MNVWTCRLQFWQHGWKVFEKRPTSFHSISQDDENKKNFHINNFLKRFLRTRRMQFRQTQRKYISTKDHNVFCPTYKHDKNIIFFFQKTVRSQDVFMDTENAVWQPRRCSLVKFGKIFAPCLKIIILISFSKNYSSSMWFYGHAECSFDNPAKTKSTKDRKFFSQCTKKIKTSCFFKKTIHFQNVPMYKKNTVLTTSPEFYRWKLEKYPLKVRKIENNNIFFSTNFPSSKCSFRHEECSFYNLAEDFWRKA